jgi:hypothetical protein
LLGLGAAGAAVAVAVAGALLLADPGDDDGQALDVAAPTSTEAAPATEPPPTATEVPAGDGGPPLAVRSDVAMAWTGRELVVWGGDVEAFNMGLSGGDRQYADGATFDPAAGTWRAMAASPLPATGDTAVAEAVDDVVVIARGTSTAAWRPDDDTWRTLDDAPAPVRDLHAHGRIVLSHSANARLDVDSGEWRSLPAPPLRLERPTTAWTGEELIVVGGPDTPFTKVAAIAYDPERDAWRRLPDPPFDFTGEAPSAAWDGERVIVVNYDMAAMAYDPAADAWEQLPPVPARFYEWYPTLVSTRDQTIAYYGQAVVAWRDGGWLPMPYGPVPLGRVATTRGADDRLFVWTLDHKAETNALAVVDLAALVAAPERVQVGVAAIALGEGDELVRTSYAESFTEERVDVEVWRADGAKCMVASGYSSATVELPIEEDLSNDGHPTVWSRNDAGTTWARQATTSDTVTIACDDAEAARSLAASASFTPP